jgi:hypothetical protein
MALIGFETSDGLPAARHIPGGKDCQRERSKASPFVFAGQLWPPGLKTAIAAEGNVAELPMPLNFNRPRK